jgi:hypothetical protein
MTRRLVALMASVVLLACSTVPSFADHHGGGHSGGGGGWHGAGGGWHAGGGNWNGGGWHGGQGGWHGGGGGWHHGHGGGWGVGPAIGLGVGLGLLGGALATAPYYGGYYDYGYAPYAGSPAPTVWYWCDPYQGYYPAVPECPVPWRQIVQ